MTTMTKPAPKATKPTAAEILAKVAAGTLSPADASVLLAEVPQSNGLRCKVSEKGAVSVYNLQRMPVTLYGEQWVRLLDFADEIRAFIKANDGQLKKKDRS